MAGEWLQRDGLATGKPLRHAVRLADLDRAGPVVSWCKNGSCPAVLYQSSAPDNPERAPASNAKAAARGRFCGHADARRLIQSPSTTGVVKIRRGWDNCARGAQPPPPATQRERSPHNPFRVGEARSRVFIQQGHERALSATTRPRWPAPPPPPSPHGAVSPVQVADSKHMHATQKSKAHLQARAEGSRSAASAGTLSRSPSIHVHQLTVSGYHTTAHGCTGKSQTCKGALVPPPVQRSPSPPFAAAPPPASAIACLRRVLALDAPLAPPAPQAGAPRFVLLADTTRRRAPRCPPATGVAGVGKG